MKSFTQKAVYAALAGASLTMAGGASAVNINNDGLGEALIYPYYTTRDGQATLLSVVNTTTVAKAVKVRFLEGKNTAEVLDFNLWLSPKDVWTAAIVASGDGARVITADKSCTNPKIPAGGQAFSNGAYTTDNAALRTLDRTKEGYIEIIEMATVLPLSPTEDDVTHGTDRTPDCKLVSNASVRLRAADYRLPTGGLFGNGTVVGKSQSTGYNATAIEGMGYTALVTDSGDIQPNLGSGTNATAVVVDSPAPGTSRITAATFPGLLGPLDAVSAVMMHSSVMGEYSYDKTFGTDWVITMPTKRPHVNRPAPARAPFQNVWDGASSTGRGVACVDIGIASYDREEQFSISDDAFSPRNDAAVPQLCFESTVVAFREASVTGPSSVLKSVNSATYQAYQDPASAGGWAELTFGAGTYIPVLATATAQTTLVTSAGIGAPTSAPVSFIGLPAIGFSIVSGAFPNSADNYNSSYSLNFRRTIR